jgi:hypothetical protein
MPKIVFGEKKKSEYDKTGRKASRERRSRKRQQVQPGTMAVLSPFSYHLFPS